MISRLHRLGCGKGVGEDAGYVNPSGSLFSSLLRTG